MVFFESAGIIALLLLLRGVSRRRPLLVRSRLALKLHVKLASRGANTLPVLRNHHQLLHEFLRLRLLLHLDHLQNAVGQLFREPLPCVHLVH